MRISTRLIMLLIAAVLCVMGVYAVVTISGTRALLTEELRKMAEHISLALSVGALHHLELGDAEGVKEVLETISRNPDVCGAAVFGLDGELVAASDSMATELEVEGKEQVLTHLEGKGWFEDRDTHRVYVYTTGIQSQEGQQIGSLRLALLERSMLPHTLQLRNNVLITIGVLAGTLSLLVSYVSQTQIARPLRALTEGTESIGKGELGRRIDIGQPGEVGELASAFNRMAENLEASNQKLVGEREHIQDIVDSIPEGVLVIDRDGRVTTWNQTMAQNHGRPVADVLGRPIEEALPGVDSDEFWQMVRRLQNGEQDRCEIRELIVATATERVLSVVGSPLVATGGREGGAVLVLIDITDRVRLERQVQQSEKLAAVGQLAAGVAHEIGTPLNVISGSAEYLLMEAKREDPRMAELKTIVSEVGRITDLVKRLMAFARQSEPTIEPVDVSALIDSVLVLLRGQIEKQGVKIHVHIEPDPPDVMGDRVQLQQVLLNLIMNAWHAMPEGGELRVTGQSESPNGSANTDSGTPPRFLSLTVEDTGVGIAQDDVARVFDPFFTTKDVGEGTGLGLSIVHRIVEDHGGHITVASDGEGRGSTFKVYLPAAGGVQSDG